MAQRGLRAVRLALGVIRLACALLLAVACASPTPIPTATPTATPTTQPTNTPTTTASPAPTTAVITFEDGVHVVPDEVAPGIYRTTTSTTACIWTRLHDTSGIHGVIVTNLGSGYQLVEIAPTDGAFGSQDCGGWTSDLSAMVDVPYPGDGIYLVGEDLEPGFWAPSELSSCYWARLSGLSGEERDIIEDDLIETTGQPMPVPLIRLEQSDVAFLSDGCGMWSRLRDMPT